MHKGLNPSGRAIYIKLYANFSLRILTLTKKFCVCIYLNIHLDNKLHNGQFYFP